MKKPRISYIDPATTDAAMQAEFARCAREGTPRPESQAVRAHVPAVFWSFANTWRDTFHTGIADHGIKELCRLYVSRSVMCEFCGNQRSMKAASAGAVIEDHVKDLINFETSTRTTTGRRPPSPTPRRSPGTCRSTTSSGRGCTQHFSEPELVEIGYFIAITMGQQRWLRTLNIEHHQVLVGAERLDGAGLRDRGRAQALQGRPDLLGEQEARARIRGGGVASPRAPSITVTLRCELP